MSRPSFISVMCAAFCVSVPAWADDPEPANDKCNNATPITCGQALANQTIQRTPKRDKEKGEDPKGSLREDVWYSLTIPQGTSQWVEITATGDGDLKLSTGLYAGTCGANGETNNMQELAWDDDGKVKRCLAGGKYFIVVDENRDKEADLPTSNQFLIEVMCVPWQPGFSSVSIDPNQCPLAVDGTQFIEHTTWPVHVVPAGVVAGAPYPPRLPDTAKWVKADAFGNLISTDLEQTLGELPNPGQLAPPAVVSRSLPAGVYDVIIDDGDGVYDPTIDINLAETFLFEPCFVLSGACCLDVDGTCADATPPELCAVSDGVYMGDDVPCADAGCPIIPTGACCLPNGDCGTVYTEKDCHADGGVWAAGATCADLCAAEPCPGDCGDGDGTTGTADLLALLASWGGPSSCDLDGDGIVGTGDLLQLLAQWGPCG